MRKDLDKLKALGRNVQAAGDYDPSVLDAFDNQHPGRDYWVTFTCPEFTTLCPKTGQPDYGTITFEYIADKLCVELKSLKFYLQAYRNEGVFYERLTNQILDDMVSTMQPRYIKVTAEFTPRGGLHSKIVVEHADPEWGGTCACGCNCGRE